LRTLKDGYALHQLNTGRSGDVGLIFEAELIGFYVDQTIALSERHQGKSLSIPMILEGTKHRTLPSSRLHTSAGKKAFEKAWRVVNGFEPNPWP
jgi:hypothetical protein